MWAIVSLLRVKHWIKNLIVLIPFCWVGAPKWNLDNAMKMLTAFGSFCIAASLVYIFNDLIDRKSDQAHPYKKYRPLASGAIKIYQAILLLLTLAGGLAAIQIKTGAASLVILSYLGLNLLYSLWLKRVPVIDLMMIATCYLLRLSAGLEALEGKMSYWVLVAIFFITLSIIASKRRSEKMLENRESSSRKVLQYYNIEYLNLIILISTIGAVNCYILYVHDLFAVHPSDPLIIYSIPVILFGILKYLHTIFMESQSDDPVEVILKDASLMLVSLVCLVFLARYSV